jgi:hypothetical protein
MGFSWKSLLPIAGAVAAPFTGGASLGLTAGLGGALKSALPGIIGGVASGIAGGAQKGREAQNTAAQDAAQFAQRENAAKESSLMGRAGLDLQQRGFTQQSQGDAYQKALKSALAMNMKDVTLDMPSRISKFNFSGGLRPSALGAEGKAAAGELNKQAMLKLMNGEKFDALPAYQGTAAPKYKGPGVLENLAGVAGLAGNTINTALGAQEDRGNLQKYIAAIEALTKQGQPQPSDGPGVPMVPPVVKRPVEPLAPSM